MSIEMKGKTVAADAPRKGALAACVGVGGGAGGGVGTATTGCLIAVDWLVWLAAAEGADVLRGWREIGWVVGGGSVVSSGRVSVAEESRMREPSNDGMTTLTQKH